MEAKKIHGFAMEWSFEASIEKDKHKRIALYYRAFVLEKQAAMMYLDKKDIEPTRGILFRSAAWLAIKAEKYGEAIDLCKEGLSNITMFPKTVEELEEALREAQRLFRL